jgi:hypothetical protein
MLIQDPVSAREGQTLTVTFTPQSNFRSSVAVDVGRSLMGYWRFSGKGKQLADSSSWESDGALKGDAVRAEGWFGRGVGLDGEGSFVSFPDIEIAENGTATFDGWFRFRSFAMDNVQNTGLISGLYQHGDTNNFYFSRTNEHFPVRSLLNRDTWHHIVLSWDGDASSAVIYIDGQRVPVIVQGDAEEIKAIDGLNVGRSAGYLGGLIGSARHTFHGDIDEIRVWNRVLSPAEVMASYRAGRERLSLDIGVGDGADPEWVVVGANAADRELNGRQ